jgi:hypothetical protein
MAILLAGRPRNHGLFPVNGRKLISSLKRPASLQWILKAYFPEVKQLGPNVYNCISSRAHTKKQWGCTFTPTYTFVAVIRTISSCLLDACIKPTLPGSLFVAPWKSAVRSLQAYLLTAAHQTNCNYFIQFYCNSVHNLQLTKRDTLLTLQK